MSKSNDFKLITKQDYYFRERKGEQAEALKDDAEKRCDKDAELRNRKKSIKFKSNKEKTNSRQNSIRSHQTPSPYRVSHECNELYIFILKLCEQNSQLSHYVVYFQCSHMHLWHLITKISKFLSSGLIIRSESL